MGFFDFLKNKSKSTDENSENQVLPDKAELKAQLDTIQKEIYKFLKPLGFKKKGRTFNRQTEDGVYQVINIQSGKYEFGDKYVIPGFRENYYGKFTINLGVLVEEIYQMGEERELKDFYQEYDCSIRIRLPILTQKKDFWWSISDSTDKISQQIINGLNEKGINWLDNFETRKKICENWGNIEGSTKRAKLETGLIILKFDRKKGTELIQDYYKNINNRPHKEFVEKLSKRLNITLE